MPLLQFVSSTQTVTAGVRTTSMLQVERGALRILCSSALDALLLKPQANSLPEQATRLMQHAFSISTVMAFARTSGAANIAIKA